MAMQYRPQPGGARGMRLAPAACVLAACLALPAHALGLLQAWQLAAGHDPALRAALAAREAGQEAPAIARAALLPQLSLTYSNSPHNRQEARTSQTDALGNVYDNTQKRTYTSYAGNLVLRQPLYDPAAWARWRQAQAQALLADAQWRGQAQDLVLRLARAYTDVLFARQQQALAAAQRRALAEQLERNTEATRLGDGTVTDIAETRARLALAEAQDIDARDTAEVAQRALESLIGVPLTSAGAPDMLPEDFNAAPEPEGIEQWRELALSRNPEIAAQRQALEAALLEVRRQQAGHKPRAELFAAQSQNRSEIASTYNQRYSTTSVGVQFVLPLFAGGGTSAAVRQAAHQSESARHTLEAKTAEVELEVLRQWRLSTSGPARIAAQQAAVKAAEAALEGTRRSMAGGERINLDVLNAEQLLYTARRDLARARFDYLLARLALRQRAGVLDETTLAGIAAFFTQTAPQGVMPSTNPSQRDLQ